MKITDVLLGEHSVFRTLFDWVDRTVAEAGSLAEVAAPATMVTSALARHAALEDEYLFAALGALPGPWTLLAELRLERAIVDCALHEAQETEDMREARDLVRDALQLARDHFGRVERELFGLAEHTLGGDRLTQQGAWWAQARGLNLSHQPPPGLHRPGAFIGN